MTAYANWRCWIFDLDGTLTRAVHDFEAIRLELGIAKGRPILEALAAMPAEDAAPLHRRLEEIELELARDAQPAPGAALLLAALAERGRELGIVTRNGGHIARTTLQAAGLSHFFSAGSVIGREDAQPKPSPDGIQALLERWTARASEAVMVGDYVFDLQAGRAAGVATVYVDETERYVFAEHADHRVSDLGALGMRLRH